MKKNLFLFLLTAALGCRKNSDGPLLLRQIKIDNNVSQSFEYSNGLLLKEKWYYFCHNSPTDEYTYIYRNGKLDKLDITLRSLYSSTLIACDPASGQKSEEIFEYDNQGRLLKVSRAPSYTLFEYNFANLVQKMVLYYTNGVPIDSTTFNYDSRGNLIKETNARGGIALYEYDNHKNPFYLMKQKPGWISPYNTSPSNVIKGTGFANFERKILAYKNGLPAQVLESGVTYVYFYQ